MAEFPDIGPSLPDCDDPALAGVLCAMKPPPAEDQFVGQASSSSCKSLGVTDEGNQWVKWLEMASHSIIAALSIKGALEAARAEKELADKYMAMAKEAREHYNNYYKPLEEDSVAWACSQEEYVRDKDRTQIGRSILSARMAYKNKAQNAINCVSRYCSGLRATMLRDALLEEAQAVAAAGMAGLRYEKKYEVSMNDLRFDRRNNMLKIGRDLSASATELARFSNDVRNDGEAQMTVVANSTMKRLGYVYEREYTPPPVRREYTRNDSQITLEKQKFEVVQTKEELPNIGTTSG